MVNNRRFRIGQLSVVAISMMLSAACTLSKDSAPPLAGPSELGLSVGITATPNSLPADGSSVSVVRVVVHGTQGQPIAGQRLTLGATNGVLSSTDVTTGDNGEATVQFTAPSSNAVSSTTVTIFATPMSATVNNTAAQTASIRLTGIALPTAAFSVSSVTPGLNDFVTFDASTTTIDGAFCGTQCIYAWDFGDGISATGITTSHRYASRGTFIAHLAVTSPTGTIAGTDKSITVGSPTELVAQITFSPTNPAVGDTVYFDARGSSTPDGVAIVSYMWDFGDGSRDSGETEDHIYGAARTFTVRLTIVDALGRTATTTATVTVK